MQPDAISHTCTYVCMYVYTCLRERLCERIPKLSNRSLDAVRDSSKEFLLFRVLLHICIQTFFPEHVGDFPPAGVCKIARQGEEGKRRKRKNIFWYEEQGGGCHPQSHVCHAAIFEDCQRQRGMPPRKLTFANDNGRNCLGKKKTKKKKHLSDFLDKEPWHW